MEIYDDNFSAMVIESLREKQKYGPAILSLDVFDTLVYRTVRSPADVFFVAGQSLSSAQLISVSPLAFAQFRRTAEQRSRSVQFRNTGFDEVNLEDIYSCMPLQGIFASTSAMIEVEIAAEKSVLQLDQRLSKICAAAVKSGALLHLVSNTYYSENQLRALLESAGFDSAIISGIWASSENKVSKEKGLFAKVLESLKVAPSQVLHIGDDPAGDVAAAENLNIDVLHYAKFDQLCPDICRKEDRIYRHFVPVFCRDFKNSGLDGLRARLLLTAADHDSSDCLTENAAWKLGATAFGPVLAGFIQWLADRCQGSASLVCFVTREGFFLNELMRNYCDSRNIAVPSVVLQTSRTVLSRASLIQVTEEELRWIIHSRRTPLTPRRFAELFGLKPAELEVPANLLDFPLRRDEAETNQFIEYLLSSRNLIASLQESSKSARDQLVKYVFSQIEAAVKEVVSDSLKIVLADLGWSGRSHIQLSRALREQHPGLEISGMYMALEDSALAALAAGEHLEGFLHNCGDTGGFGHLMLRCKEIPEQITMPPDIGTTLGFDAQFRPITAPRPVNPSIVNEKLERIRKGIRDFFDFYLKQLSEGLKINLADPDARAALRILYARPLILPLEEESAFLRELPHDEGNFSNACSKIVGPLDELIAEYATMEELERLSLYWPIGALFQRRRQLLNSYLNSYADFPYQSQISWEFGKYKFKAESCFALSEKGTNILTTERKIEIYFDSDNRTLCSIGFFINQPTRFKWHLLESIDSFRIEKVLIQVWNTRTNQRSTAFLPAGDYRESTGEVKDAGFLSFYGFDRLEFVIEGASFFSPLEVNVFIGGSKRG